MRDCGKDRIEDCAARIKIPRERLLFLCRLLLRQAGVVALGKLALEFLDASCRIDELQLARVERMTHVADIELQLRAGTAGAERIPTTACDLGLEVLWMNAFLHSLNSCCAFTAALVGLDRHGLMAQTSFR